MSAGQTLQILMVYLLSGLLLYPIVAYTLYYDLRYQVQFFFTGPVWFYIQIFFSGPGLMVLGWFLFLKCRGLVHKVFGVAFMVIAVYWIGRIVTTIIREAA